MRNKTPFFAALAGLMSLHQVGTIEFVKAHERLLSEGVRQKNRRSAHRFSGVAKAKRLAIKRKNIAKH